MGGSWSHLKPVGAPSERSVSCLSRQEEQRQAAYSALSLRDGVLAGVAAARLWDAGRFCAPRQREARRDLLCAET